MASGRMLWYIMTYRTILDPSPDDSTRRSNRIGSSIHKLHRSLARTSKCINAESADNNFGADNKPYAYAHAWFLRSLIPTFCDTSLDAKGFPLLLSDFHSQNINDNSVRNLSVYHCRHDWECSIASPMSFFCTVPALHCDHQRG